MVEASNFEFSQIEIGKSGKLYLAHQQGLATFSNPNTPNLGVLTLTAVTFSYSANREGYMGNNESLKSYMLPDQIDGMDYSGIGFPSMHNITTYTAGTNATWEPGYGLNPWDVTNAQIYVQDKLIIPSGKNVVIKNMTFRFAPEAEVIVKQGGRLTLDNSVFTNAHLSCDNKEADFWQGIQVYGTTNKSQHPGTQSPYQGMLVLKNGGTIENAHKAVTNWRQGYWAEIGGIIQSTDGIFRNNRRDVEFMAYTNHAPNNPSNILPNRSFFNTTSFISNNDFIEKNLVIQEHITLWDVEGIQFLGCDFSNSITINKVSSSAPRQAIYALDAGFLVGDHCSVSLPFGQPCPTSNKTKSSFTGLVTAIEATASGTSKAVTVFESDFTNVINGVLINQIDNVSINNNEIKLGSGGYSGLPIKGGGIQVDDATGFLIEENNVTRFSYGLFHGIGITNCGPTDNRVYKNTISDLNYGGVSMGANHNTNYQKGLQFLCNGYEDNETAIKVGNNHQAPDFDGMRIYQGDYYSVSSQKSAGNIFLNNTMDIDNDGNTINYYYKGANTEPINYTPTSMVHTMLASDANTCPSSFGGGYIPGPLFSQVVIDSVKVQLQNLQSDYNNLYFTYVSLIDGGNTGQFKEDIEINWSNDAWVLRGELIEESPYLSSEVLLTTAEQNVLPNGMLLEVLLANPEATRDEGFIDALREVTNNSFPEYMIAYVSTNDIKTLRSDLEGQLAAIHGELDETKNWLTYISKSKEEYTYAERLATVRKGDGIYHKAGLIDFYVEHEDFVSADSVLQAVMSDEEYLGDLKLIEGFDAYLNFRSSLGNRNIAQLDSSEIEYLKTLAENENRVTGYAQNILCFFYDICYDDEFPDGQSSNKMLILPSGDEPTLEEILYNITVYPNPANDFTSIKWEIYDELKDAQYKIYDMNGREMRSGIIETNTGEKVIDTRNLDNGVYIINIYNNGAVKLNAKLVESKER